MDEASIERVRDAWRQVLGAPAAFRDAGAVVVARPARPVPGPRWVTVVTLGDSRCVLLPADLAANLVDPAPADPAGAPEPASSGPGSAPAGPDPATADPTGGPDSTRADPTGGLEPAIAGQLADPARARAILGPGIAVLGPAVLAYTADLTASPAPSPAEPAEPGAAGLDQLGAACDPADAAESALAAWTHWIHLVRERDLVVAAAGAQVWAGTLAHLGVLTRPDRRGRGLGTTVASSVVRAALAAGLVVQWRARTELAPSRRLAAALGFVELGEQVSYELPDPSRPRRH